MEQPLLGATSLMFFFSLLSFDAFSFNGELLDDTAELDDEDEKVIDSLLDVVSYLALVI